MDVTLRAGDLQLAAQAVAGLAGGEKLGELETAVQRLEAAARTVPADIAQPIVDGARHNVARALSARLAHSPTRTRTRAASR